MYNDMTKSAAMAVICARNRVVLGVLALGLAASASAQTPAGAYQTVHFRLEAQRDAAWSTQMGGLLEGLYTAFYHDLSQAGFQLRAPDQPLTWIGFDDAEEFGQHARVRDQFDASWLQGYYSSRTNQVALIRSAFLLPAPTPAESTATAPLDVRRISHELAHQLTYNSGLLRRGVMHPAWLTEGLATNFEAESLAEVGFGHVNQARWNQLREMQQRGALVSLAEFVVMTEFRPTAPAQTSDLYAQADGFFRFLLLRHPAELKAYMECLAGLPAGERAGTQRMEEFSGAFGSLDRLRAEWLAFLQT